ncbi:MAG: undecaprenyl/decaprenyl-phosphate alpha-N-acetylglucosaminyl 1-phosphate transferase, partial [Planctomycetes bacterium]|nr:undecaprenyl/decaprenyl-phosphate alpha-N-acetylglucosaminyl 1-phosphate transferase [Planctomycetota bacterium]
WGRLGIIFLGGIAMAGLGVADDLWNLRVRTRLAVQFAVAIAVVGFGIHPSLAFLPAPLPSVVGVIWLVGITNSFNLVDGVDGLATGLAAIAAALLGTTMFMTNHPCPAALLFALCGACLGFLWHNWHPARVFLGSAGALFLGYMLGATTMIATFMGGESTWLFPLLIPVLVFAVPLYDTGTVILIRIGLKRPIWEGDRSHFHHRLMRIGFSHRQCVAFLWLIAMAFGLGGMLITRGGWIASLVVLAQAMVLAGVIILMERVVGRIPQAMDELRAKDANSLGDAAQGETRAPLAVPRSGTRSDRSGNLIA